MRKAIWVVWFFVIAGVIGILAWLQFGHPAAQSAIAMAAPTQVTAAQTNPNPSTPNAAATFTNTVAPKDEIKVTNTAPAAANTATAGPTAVVPTPTMVNLTPLPPMISGTVVNENGPVAGAIVQIHGQPRQTTTAKNGSFGFMQISGTTPVVLTAWTEGYYIGSATVNPSAPDYKGGKGITITLKPYYNMKDNNKYTWFSFNGVEGSASCGICHREYKEWQTDAHSHAATNPRFISMYTGSDASGNPGQIQQYDANGKIMPPDPSKPYYGPGYQLDNPGRAGNCATCHTPMASQSPNDQNCGWSGCHTSLTIERSRGVIAPAASPVGLTGDALEGISCDFCHKIGSVTLDAKTKLPLPDMPGILSYQLYRPQEGQQIFFGTLVDVPRRDTYLPLLDKSEYCAGCHYGVFGGVVGVGTVTNGTVIYNSYGEWLNSPYSDPKTGKTCQQCHMPKSDANWYVYPEQGGLERDYATLHDHTMLGVTDEQLLQNSVTMKSTAQRQGDQVIAEVSITNDQTGHDIPTDSPTRSMILVVEAFDESGKALALVNGPVNPDFSGNYGGKPGKTFAKVLKDEWTGETPTGAYWRPVTIASDNRLAALATDKTRYTFSAPAGQKVTLKIHLLYRRNFQKLAEQKGWNDPDIVMEQDNLTVAAR